MAALLLFSVFTNLLGLAGVIFTMQVYDRVLPSRSLETLAVLCVITGALFVVLGLLTAVRLRLADRIGLSMLYTHEPWTLRETAERARRTGGRPRSPTPIQDLETLVRAVRGRAVNGMLDLPWSAIFIGALWSITPLMGIFASIAAVLLIVVTLAVSWFRSTPAQENIDAVARTWEAAFRDPRGPVVIAAHSLSQGVAKARRAMREASKNSRESEHRLRGVITALRQSAQIAVLAAGAWLIIDGQATIGIMMASGILMGRVLGPIEVVLQERNTTREALSSLKRLRELRKNPVKPGALAEEALLDGVLRAERLILSPAPNADRVLSNVSFVLQPGSALLITGAGSTGKSLLLRTLAGLHVPSYGMLRLGDVRYDHIGAQAIEELIGYLPQENVFLPGTIADAIGRHDRAVPFSRVVEAAKRAHVHERILALADSYQTRLPPEGLPLSFSFGRRVALARAICHKPRVLLLDDPLAASDATMAKIVADIVQEQRAAGGMCVVAASQPVFLDIVDCVLVLGDGKVAVTGAPSEVFKPRPVNAKTPAEPGSSTERVSSERNT